MNQPPMLPPMPNDWAPLPWDLPRSASLWRAALALPDLLDESDAPDAPRRALAALAAAGLLSECVPPAHRPPGAHGEPLSVRALCVLRWGLGFRSPLLDLMFAMQGLGSYPVTLAGSPEQQAELLPRIARGEAIGAFALTEPEAGSDVVSLRCAARPVPGGYALTGHKRFISNAGLATQYVLFARTGPDPKRGISAFLVPGEAPGLRVAPQALLCEGHPIGELLLDDVFVPASARLGAEGEGLGLALRTLDTFRVTVAAAAVGMAQRALATTRAFVLSRVQFGKPLSDLPAVQAALAEMSVRVDAAALLVQRAAYLIDQGQRASRESSTAKLFATEAAHQVVDQAVQLHGGAGLVRGSVPERLYREVRSLRIYEGASEVQRLVIARSLLREGAAS